MTSERRMACAVRQAGVSWADGGGQAALGGATARPAACLR